VLAAHGPLLAAEHSSSDGVAQHGIVMDEGAADEIVPKGTWRRTAQSNAEIFGWSANEWDIHMKPTSTHICFLTRVSGNLGGASAVAVHRSTIDLQETWRSGRALTGTVLNDMATTWKLGGFQSESNSLNAEATCVPLSDFKLDPGGVTLISGMAAVIRDCGGSSSANLWSNHAVSFLTAVRGEFEGGGEKADIVSSDWVRNPAAVSTVRASSQQCKTGKHVEAIGRSFFPGVLGQTWGAFRSLSRVSISTASGPRRKQLGRTASGVCYLTKISGDLDGAPERIRIYPEMDASGAEWWWIEVTKGDGSAYADAECVSYDQRFTSVSPPI
jgi:hypothetical protein